MARHRVLKQEVFAHYGGKRLHCGETDIDVLTIDHTEQNGAAHKRQTGLATGKATWNWLKQNDYPLEFRVLCFNCNTKAFRIYTRQQKALNENP